jgi:hypothetical protein
VWHSSFLCLLCCAKSLEFYTTAKVLSLACLVLSNNGVLSYLAFSQHISMYSVIYLVLGNGSFHMLSILCGPIPEYDTRALAHYHR